LDRTVPGAVATGLAVGGIVRGGYIQRGSGITLGLTDRDAAVVTGLGADLEAQFGLPVLTAQDARSKAYYAAAQHLARNALVLDLGTSLGGAYVDPQGCIPEMLNQVGRVACDLSDDAVPRADGQGRGLLSQYVSVAGVVRLSQVLGVDVRGSSQLQEWPPPGNRGAISLVQEFRSRLEEALELLHGYYGARTVIITGGLLAGRFGDQVLASGAGSRSFRVERSTEPMYDAAIGVAWAAANEVASCSTGATTHDRDQGEA